MSLDVMKQALAALEQYTNVVTSVNDPNSWVTVADGGKPARDAITALRAAIEQAQTAPAKGGLAEKIPATGTHLETIVRKAFDQIYAEQDLERWADQEPVAWVNPKWLNPKTRHWTNDTILHKPIAGWVPLYTAPSRKWQRLTQREIDQLWDLHHDDYGNALSATGYERAIEAKLKEKNT